MASQLPVCWKFKLFMLPTTTTPSSPYDPDYGLGRVSHSPPPLGLILPVLLFVALLLAILGSFVYERIYERGRLLVSGPEIQQALILCHDENCQFEYKIILRVGCPTPNFDMRHGFIDFVVLGPEDAAQGPPVRFKCARLPDRICGEMHIEIARMTQMEPITGIMANHGDPYGAIFFYESNLIDLTNDKLLETRHFNTYLSSEATVYRGWVAGGGGEEEDGLYPELPVIGWTKLELTIIAFLTVMFIGSVTLLFETFNVVPVNRHQAGSLFRTLFATLFVTPLALLLLAAVAILYKFYLKRNVTRTEYSLDHSRSSTKIVPWSFICTVYLVYLVCMSLALFAVFVFFSLSLSLTHSLYWWCSTLLSSVLVLGVWSLANKCIAFQLLFEDSTVQLYGNYTAFHSKDGHTGNSTVHHQKTIGFSKLPTELNESNSTVANTSSLMLSHFGPKLLNPRDGKASHTKKTSKKKKNKTKDKDATRGGGSSSSRLKGSTAKRKQSPTGNADKKRRKAKKKKTKNTTSRESSVESKKGHKKKGK